MPNGVETQGQARKGGVVRVASSRRRVVASSPPWWRSPGREGIGQRTAAEDRLEQQAAVADQARVREADFRDAVRSRHEAQRRQHDLWHARRLCEDLDRRAVQVAGDSPRRGAASGADPPRPDRFSWVVPVSQGIDRHPLWPAPAADADAPHGDHGDDAPAPDPFDALPVCALCSRRERVVGRREAHFASHPSPRAVRCARVLARDSTRPGHGLPAWAACHVSMVRHHVRQRRRDGGRVSRADSC